MHRQLPLTPQILHKETTKDVLLSEFQDILPARLTHPEVTFLLEALDKMGRETLRNLYRNDAHGWILASLPTFISEHEFIILGASEMNIRNFYEHQDDGYHLNSPWLPRQVEHYLQRYYDLPIIEQAQATLLADKLYTLVGWKRANLLSYCVLNDTNNYFFYNKPHEHVPGLMLIEVARQAMYHYFYSHSGYHRGDVSISIKDLTVSFNNYTESTYPVEVVVQNTAGEKRHQPRTVDKTAMFYQNGSLVTALRLRGNAMKISLFKRMRTINFPEHHWFLPSNRVLPQVLLQTSDGRGLEGRLEHISLRGVRFSGVNEAAGLDLKQLSIYIKDVGFLSFIIANCQPSKSTGVQIAVFAQLDRTTLSALKELIKCHCFHEALQEYTLVAEAGNKSQGMPRNR